MKVAVVGGGVIGCAVAERLSRGGHRVILHERDQVGAHASGAAAGLLAPYSELRGDDLGSRSARLFPELVARLERDSGLEVEYRQTQSLAVAFDAAQRRSLRGLGEWQDVSECLRLEPGLNPDLLGAALLDESHINPPRFVQSLARTAAAGGAVILEGSPVAALADLKADRVVLAAGPWSATLAAVDVVPRRGRRPRTAGRSSARCAGTGGWWSPPVTTATASCWPRSPPSWCWRLWRRVSAGTRRSRRR